MNPLLKNYNSLKSGATAAGPSAPALHVAAAPAAPTGAPAAPAPPASTEGAKRDISALRARLAGGSLGGVNPPEAVAALPADALEPRTVPTSDGGAQAAPGWVEAKNGLVVRLPELAPLPETPTVVAARKRRTKAEMEAARAAEAAAATSGAEAPAGASVAPEPTNLGSFSTEQLLAEVLRRVASA
jgi:hypothetical protein